MFGEAANDIDADDSRTSADSMKSFFMHEPLPGLKKIITEANGTVNAVVAQNDLDGLRLLQYYGPQNPYET
jgi:hypothetical protein